jgi:hypothetical protein
MIALGNCKYFELVPPQALATNATAQTNTGNYGDMSGYDALTVIVSLGVAGATSQLPTALKLQHSDTTTDGDFTDITGFVGGTSFTIPTSQVTGVTSITAPFAVMNVPWQGKKRYVRPTVTANTSATNLCHIVGIASRAEVAPLTAAQANARVLVNPA